MSKGTQDAVGRSVARLVSPVISRLGLMITLMAVVCVGGAWWAMQPVNDVDDQLVPAASSHDRVSTSMDSLALSVERFGRSRDPVWRAAFYEEYAAWQREVPTLRTEVDGQALATEVNAELAAARRWLDEYALPQMRLAPPGTSRQTGGVEAAAKATADGAQLWGVFSEARAAADEAIAARRADTNDGTVLATQMTIVVCLLLLGVAWVMVSRARQTLLREVAQPITSLERVVQRMLRNDPEGRAVANRGPTEVRAIARALNDFADAQLRARAVEGHIQSELHVLDSAKEDFVSNVSHELRTPLTTISGYLELVAEEFEGQLEPRHDRMLEAARRNVTRLRALIDDLLALSKAENRPSEQEPADIVAIVNEAVTDVKMTAARRGIAVQVRTPDHPLLVVADKPMLHRAFLNVLTNAVKFSHDDGVVRVSVTKRPDHRVEVAVRDHGIGIPRAEIDRLGTRFFRATNAMSNEIAGTGLGLRIVQTIIDKHSGDVVIESLEGHGTTVYVRLRWFEPLRAVPSPTDPVTADSR